MSDKDPRNVKEIKPVFRWEEQVVKAPTVTKCRLDLLQRRSTFDLIAYQLDSFDLHHACLGDPRDLGCHLLRYTLGHGLLHWFEFFSHRKI